MGGLGFRVIIGLDGQGDLENMLIRGITRVAIWVIYL